MESSKYVSQVFQKLNDAEKSHNCQHLMSIKSHSADVLKLSSSTSGRCYTENRNRLRRTLIYLLIFLIPLAVEMAAAAASAELHRTRHMASRRHNREKVLNHQSDKLRHRRFSVPELIQNVTVMQLKYLPEMYSDDKRHTSHLLHHSDDSLRLRRFSVPEIIQNGSVWPSKRVAEIYGDIVIGGLHMIHEREDAIICGPVMPQGGLQAKLNT